MSLMRNANNAPPFSGITEKALLDGNREVWNKILPIFDGLDFQVRSSAGSSLNQIFAQAVRDNIAPNLRLVPKTFEKLRSRDLFTYAIVLCEHAQIKQDEARQNRNTPKEEECTRIARECLDKLDVLFELARIYLYTYEWGIHEYTSPTYTGMQANCAGLIHKYSTHQNAQDQAERLFALITCSGAFYHVDIQAQERRVRTVLGHRMHWQRSL